MPELITWPTVRAAIMELRSRSLKIDTATKQVISELGHGASEAAALAGINVVEAKDLCVPAAEP